MRLFALPAWILVTFLCCVCVRATETAPLVRTDVIGAEETEIFVPLGFKVEQVYNVPESQGSWVSLAMDNKGRIFAADQGGLLYRITTREGNKPLVEPISIYIKKADGKNNGRPIGAAQGLLWAFDSLYVIINGNAGLGSGLYRLTSSQHNDTLDSAELLTLIPGSGEHGPHGICLGPDGLLYIVAGNDCGLPKWQSSRVPLNWGGDQLLSSESRGQDWHSKNGAVPGGWVCRTDRDGKNWEIYCAGFRNHYRAAFNSDGELFTADGDDEWQSGLPWYRPPRICQVVSGGDFGWRSGPFKWPAYFPDGLPAVLDLPKGSPAGVLFGTGAKFPARYQNALYVLDWAYGKIYAAHLRDAGATFNGTMETFIRGRPLALTDALIGIDGAMYFITGGRSIQSGLYRVTYVGNEDTAPAQAPVDAGSQKARTLRHRLEALHVKNGDDAVETAWRHLGDNDAWIRYSARVALEHQTASAWQEQLFREQNPQTILTASIALARCGDNALKERLINRLLSLNWDTLSELQRIELLRAVSLVFIRMGRTGRPQELQLVNAFNAHYPCGNVELDCELCRVLVYLQADGIVDKTLPLLRTAQTQEGQIQLGVTLSNTMSAGTSEQRDKYIEWLGFAAGYQGGREVHDQIKELQQAVIAAAPAKEREQLTRLFQERTPPKPAARRLVKFWAVAELSPIVSANLTGRNYDNGRKVFHEASCIRCHYINGEGTEIGPDLTSVGSRFNVKAILESTIEPSKVISDQWSTKILKMKDGRKLFGRVLCETNGKYEFAPDPMEPWQTVDLDKLDVESIKPSAVSLMPEDLLITFTQNEIIDLMAFLISGGNKDDFVFQPKETRDARHRAQRD